MVFKVDGDILVGLSLNCHNAVLPLLDSTLGFHQEHSIKVGIINNYDLIWIMLITFISPKSPLEILLLLFDLLGVILNGNHVRFGSTQSHTPMLEQSIIGQLHRMILRNHNSRLRVGDELCMIPNRKILVLGDGSKQHNLLSWAHVD